MTYSEMSKGRNNIKPKSTKVEIPLKFIRICHGAFEIVPQEVLWSISGSRQTL